MALGCRTDVVRKLWETGDAEMVGAGCASGLCYNKFTRCYMKILASRIGGCLIIYCLLLVLPSVSMAETYYIAPNGQDKGNGTRKAPWPSVDYALGKVGGGNIIVLLPGMYQGPIIIKKEWAGTEMSPTVIRADVKWQALISGSTSHCIFTESGCDWVVIEGLRCQGARTDGIKLGGDYTIVRNCWVHSSGEQGIASHTRRGNILERNLVEFNGIHPNFHHGIYADGQDLVVRYNIVRHNAGYGLHLYPKLQRALVVGNLVYGHADRPAVVIVSSPDGGHNRILYNTFVSNASDSLCLEHTVNDILVGNILIARYKALNNYKPVGPVVADYNLCVPADPGTQGPHGLSSDPGFLLPGKGVYWLKADSPARGKGSDQFAPAEDFWGRAVNKADPIDLGCCRFVPGMAEFMARVGYEQWVYEYYPNRAMGMPDLWRSPN